MTAMGRRHAALLWLHFGWICVLLILTRLSMQWAFLAEFPADEDRWAMHWTGARLDFRVASLATAPLLLLCILCACRPELRRPAIRWAPKLAGLATGVVGLFALVNHYWYATYHTPIDIFVFGIWDEDTSAVLETVWRDYPILRATAALGALIWLTGWWVRRVLDVTASETSSRRSDLLLLCVHVPLLVLAARGSLAGRPMQRERTRVSQSPTVNALVPNGLIAFYWAAQDRARTEPFRTVSEAERLRLEAAVGFGSYSKTPPNAALAAMAPHVVAVLMESCGTNLLDLDEPGSLDLLGRLRGQFDQGLLFRRFLPASGGTASTLSALLFQSHHENVASSAASRTRLVGSPFDVYQRAGYRTAFVTPGNLNWRNLGSFLSAQGNVELYDENDLLRRYPGCADAKGAWGVPDEYCYRLIEDLLRESDAPMFIAVLTISNHSPFDLVPQTQREDFRELPSEFLERVRGDSDLARDNAAGLRYANDALGGFLENLDAMKLRRPTVLAATGDHRTRDIAARLPREQVLDCAVPLFLRVPEEIRTVKSVRYDPQRVGSHKDIFPTLYACSLAEAEFLSLGGRDLLAAEDDAARAFGVHPSLWIDAHGAQTESARYRWEERGAHDVFVGSVATAPEKAIAVRQAAYFELQAWHLNARVMGVQADATPQR